MKDMKVPLQQLTFVCFFMSIRGLCRGHWWERQKEKTTPRKPKLMREDPFHITPSNFSNIHLDIIHPPTSWSS
jgi:hypothetical protein